MKKLLGTVMSCMILAGSVSAWTGEDNPQNMDNRYRMKFSSLPTEGKLLLVKLHGHHHFGQKFMVGSHLDGITTIKVSHLLNHFI